MTNELHILRQAIKTVRNGQEIVGLRYGRLPERGDDTSQSQITVWMTRPHSHQDLPAVSTLYTNHHIDQYWKQIAYTYELTTIGDHLAIKMSAVRAVHMDDVISIRLAHPDKRKLHLLTIPAHRLRSAELQQLAELSRKLIQPSTMPPAKGKRP